MCAPVFAFDQAVSGRWRKMLSKPMRLLLLVDDVLSHHHANCNAGVSILETLAVMRHIPRDEKTFSFLWAQIFIFTLIYTLSNLFFSFLHRRMQWWLLRVLLLFRSKAIEKWQIDEYVQNKSIQSWTNRRVHFNRNHSQIRVKRRKRCSLDFLGGSTDLVHFFWCVICRSQPVLFVIISALENNTFLFSHC